MNTVSAIDLFFTLAVKIVPLYVIIALGYFAARRFDIKREAVATLLIYTITPFVFFGATAQMKIDSSVLIYPFILFGFALVMGLLAYKIARHMWQDGRKNIVGFTMGTANQGYFGIPVFLALFGPEYLGVYVFIGLGFSLYEGTVGYYLMARGRYAVKDSFLRLFKLPLIPASLLGVAFSLSGFELTPMAKEFYITFKGAYTVLGMMIIGLSLGSLKSVTSDLPFTAFVVLFKFVLWPMLAFVFLKGLDFAGIVIPEHIRAIIVLLASLPLAANAAAFAAQMNVAPEKAGSVVFITTMIALVYIPLVMSLL